MTEPKKLYAIARDLIDLSGKPHRQYLCAVEPRWTDNLSEADLSDDQEETEIRAEDWADYMATKGYGLPIITVEVDPEETS